MSLRLSLRHLALFCVGALTACASLSGAPPKGADEAPSAEDAALMREVGEKANGTIVWSSSRVGNHDLFTMKTDGSEVTQITKGEHVDWFPRFSPSGEKILFCRSKKGWVSERDANTSDKWDIYTINPDGSEPKKVVESASWGSWISEDEILFVRDTKVFRAKLGETSLTELAVPARFLRSTEVNMNAVPGDPDMGEGPRFAMALAYADMVRAIKNGGQPRPGFPQALHTHAVVEAAHRSAVERRWIAVEEML